MNLDTIGQFIIKNGATGVLVVLFFINNNRINDLETRLYNCYENKSIIRSFSGNNSNKTKGGKEKLFAVLPKNQDYEEIFKESNKPNS